ncbi:MAG: tetratricopeptide repeat protein [Dehalococcoidia bacterium]|nr:tetratricopeptide repeat protein [Dehalococcoidia bacterium]
MTYQEERLASLKRQRTKQAIDLAMQGRWREAVAANRAILEDFHNDVEAWNRLGRAHMELGEYQQSREAYRRTAALDPFNAIARKNLQRLNYLGEAKVTAEGPARKVEPHRFIEDIGKAGVVNLYHLAPTQVRARLVAGDELFLKTDGTRLVVEDDLGQYVGHVDPKHGQRLVKLMGGGNKYSVAVVGSTEEAMTVIIQETYRDPSQIGKLSFPSKGAEEIKPYVDEKVFKMESEIEKILPEESGYTIIGGDEIEVLPEESTGISDESASEEE